MEERILGDESGERKGETEQIAKDANFGVQRRLRRCLLVSGGNASKE